ncbi:MAG: PLDc N-terminal domain-containing protein [Ignavibacteria bacterium]
MKKTKLFSKSFSAPLFILFVLSFISSIVQAQPQNMDTEGCAACGVFTGVMILIPVLWFAISIALLVWTARDAKSRGMDGAVLWMILVLFLGPIGLLIYIFSRPQGNLIQCPQCNNKRLQASAKCPHCNNI